MYNFLMLLSSGRTEEPANFLAAPAPDIFSNQLRLLFFFKWPKKATPAPKLPDTDFRLFATPSSFFCQYSSGSFLLLAAPAKAKTF